MKLSDGAPNRERFGHPDPTRYPERLVPDSAEAAYERLVGYGFARRYVGGKTVADVCWGEVGWGSRLLAETAASVRGLSSSFEEARVASSLYPAPNVGYERADLPTLPYPDGHFDVVVALGVIANIDWPEDMVREARRVLKPDGVFVACVPDGSIPVGARIGRTRMYPQEILEEHFEQVSTYRLGAVAGGIVVPASGGTEALAESVPLPPADPLPGEEPPVTRSILAVCSGEGMPEPDGRAYLLLDRDRRIFDECEDCAEDLELLRDEIQVMQNTEVQAFRESLRLRTSEIAYLRAQVRRLLRSEAQLRSSSEARIRNLERQIREMENSTTWRIFEPYRRLRARLDAMKKSTSRGAGGSEDNRAN